MNKNKLAAAIKVILKHYGRYFLAAALFVVLAIVVVKLVSPDGTVSAGTKNAPEVKTSGNNGGESYSVDADEKINELIQKYYTYYANADIPGLETVAVPISDNEKSFIQMYTSYVDSYENLACYTKQGLNEGDRLVSVYLEIKFNGVDTLAPGLDFFYVQTDDEGKYYINNLYSQYNSLTREQPTDPAIDTLIEAFESQDDVVALQNDVQSQYEAAVNSDENLKRLVNTDIKDAYATWAQSLGGGAETETAEAETETESAGTEESLAALTLLTTSRVNVRDGADQNANLLDTLDEGTEVTLVQDNGNGWYNVVYGGGKSGYILSDYLKLKDDGTAGAAARTENAAGTGTAAGTEEAAAAAAPEQPEQAVTQEAANTNTGGAPAKGTFTVSESLNVRSDASETANKLGTVYTGEQVNVIENLDSGWTKVEWNGQTGYIRTDLLK